MSSSQSSSVLLQMQMTTYAQKALTCFDTLAGVSGVWDIFITKHVEVCLKPFTISQLLLKSQLLLFTFNFSCFCRRLLIFFESNFFKKFFQEQMSIAE